MTSQKIVPRLHWLLFLTFCAGIVAVALIFFDAFSNDRSRKFLLTPEFVVWAALYVFLFIIYAVFCVPLWSKLFVYSRTYTKYRRDAFVTACMILCLAVIPDTLASLFLVPVTAFPLTHQAAKSLINVAIGLLAISFPAAFVLSVVYYVLRDMRKTDTVNISYLKQYIELRNTVSLTLLLVGGHIGVGVLSTAAVRQSLIAQGTVTSAAFPPLFVLGYGAYFTMLLLLIYLPTYIFLTEVKERLLDYYVDLPDPRDKTWKDKYAHRKDFDEYLVLSLSPLQNVQVSLALLAPILSGIVPLLLGT